MCVGIPVQVIEVAEGQALCDDRGTLRWFDTRLVGSVMPGEWLMTFLDAARERMDALSARRSLDALAALDAAMRGDSASIDALFADLIEREPTLPDHLVAESPLS